MKRIRMTKRATALYDIGGAEWCDVKRQLVKRARRLGGHVEIETNDGIVIEAIDADTDEGTR